MADPAVTFLLQTLTQLVKDYYNLIAGAKNEMVQLNNQLGLLQAFLRQASKEQKKEEPFREMERQIREVVHDIEDTIDTCLTHAATAKGKNIFFCIAINTKRVNLAKQVKSLREEKVKPMFEDATHKFANKRTGDGSGASVLQPSTKKSENKEDFKLRQGDHVIGYENDEEIIIRALKAEGDDLDVISIVGMPGMGKTTLAWKVFTNENIQSVFKCIWVDVSQELNMTGVLLKILQELMGEEGMPSTSDCKMLGRAVSVSLASVKFLLVMDDVWTTDAWNSIKEVLPMGNKESKVIITSRERQVGAHASFPRKPHGLTGLEEDKSWELLQLEVFRNPKNCPKELKAIGRRIARQCHRLPLAIVVVGGILRELLSTLERTAAVENAWQEVSNNLSSIAAKHDEGRILNIVEFSYNTLADDLKNCFLYLGVFPEDYEIPVWTLTRLWIAEGFIQHEEKGKEGQSLEETADKNLKDLINKNLLMVGETTPNGEIKTCRVLDVIRQFCIFKAKNNEQNLFQEIKKSNEGVFSPPVSVSELQKCRRLCIHSNLPDFLKELVSQEVKGPGPRVRSFLCFYKEPCILDPTYISTIPDAFDLLRVLDYRSVKLTEFPTKITKLMHLRYLTLSYKNLEVLPEDLTELWNLQTLFVDTESRTLQIDANLWKMIQLRHVKTKAEIILQQAKKGGGKGGDNLRTLSRLSPKCCNEDVFKRARNLKKLGIRGCLADDLELNSLKNLDYLENLKLVNDVLYGSTSNKPMRGLPQPESFPRQLKRLTLSATYIDWIHMRTLGNIHALQVLKLKDHAFKGDSWDTVDGGSFPCLQFLLIETIDFVFWKASDDHFPKLTCLVIRNCVELSQIPIGLAKSLQILEIEHSKSAEVSANEIENKIREQGQKNTRWGGFKLTIKS